MSAVRPTSEQRRRDRLRCTRWLVSPRNSIAPPTIDWTQSAPAANPRGRKSHLASIVMRWFNRNITIALPTYNTAFREWEAAHTARKRDQSAARNAMGNGVYQRRCRRGRSSSPAPGIQQPVPSIQPGSRSRRRPLTDSLTWAGRGGTITRVRVRVGVRGTARLRRAVTGRGRAHSGSLPLPLSKRIAIGTGRSTRS
jgi:hypothetical protein